MQTARRPSLGIVCFLGWPTNPMISPLSKQCQNDILKERLNPAPERENYPNATRAPLAIPPLLTPHCNVEGLQCIINTLQSISDTLQLTTIAPALNLEGEQAHQLASGRDPSWHQMLLIDDKPIRSRIKCRL